MKRDEVVFKGSKDGLQVILDDQADFDQIVQRFTKRLQSADYFFRGADVTLDTGERELTEEQVLVLEDLARRHRLNVVKVVSKSSRTERKATARRVVETTDETLLHRKTLRSGQNIEFAGNVVILGDVNPGAQIRAGGDIVVMGTLRGVAHAGATGNEEACVVALHLRPTQLRIGSFIGRPAEEDETRSIAPEVARVKNGTIFIEHLHIS